MKMFLIAISLMSFAVAAKADTLKASTGHKTFETFSSLLDEDVKAAGHSLKSYMKTSVGCTKARLDLNIHEEESFFNSGVFSLDLTAECDQSVSDVQIDFDPLCSEENNGEAALTVQFTKAGQKLSKKFLVTNSGSCRE